VFENISTGVCVLDRHDQLVDLNAAGRALLDISEDALGTPFRTLAPTDTFYEHIQDPTAQRKIIRIDDDHRSDPEATGPRYYEVQVTPIEASHRRPNGRIVVVNDVTNRQRQQRQLERQNERLEAFTSVVSHDLRNPLNVASGNVTLARENGDGDHLEHADRALTRMETLIDDLLALAHGGQQVNDPEPVALHDVVADAWETVDTRAAALENRTETTLIADPSRLHQFIANLFRNAVEHGGETVTIRVGDQSGGFYVADDGSGLPSDKREEIFTTGYSTRDHGTGLGLNIVQKIADAHEWDVHATESVEGGARFEVTGVERID
jgi:signal transduction histidine kinase